MLIVRHRLDGLGDLVFFSGVLRHLRRCYYDWHGTLAVAERYRLLFQNCPFIDELVPNERFSVPEPLALTSRFPRLKPWADAFRNAGLYDQVVFWWRMMSLREHELAASFLPSPVIGIAGDRLLQTEEEDAAATPVYTRRLDLTAGQLWDHELAVNLRFARFLGAEVGSTAEIWPEFWLQPPDRELVQRWFSLLPPTLARLAVAPSSYRTERNWPAAKLGALLARTPEVAVVFLGTARESALVAEIASHLRPGTPFVNLAGQLGVRELVAAVEASDAFIGMDSGPLHIAIALRKPAVGLVGGGTFGRYVDWGDRERANLLRVPMDCYGCNWRCTKAYARCVHDISVDDACMALRQALQGVSVQPRN